MHSSGCLETRWRPLADIYHTPKGWILKYELAGVRAEDVRLDIAGRRITVSGVRRDWTLEEGCVYYSLEICYSRFERTIELPCDLEEMSVKVEFRDGLLLVRAAGEGGKR